MINQLRRLLFKKPHSDPILSSTIDEKTFISSLINIKSWDLLSKIINEKPELAKVFISVHQHGKHVERLPIHEVCRKNPPLYLIQKLESAYPSSLIFEDESNGCVPLHFACRHGASTEVISFLLKISPHSINIEDKYGCAPIIVARRSSCKHRDEIIDLFNCSA